MKRAVARRLMSPWGKARSAVRGLAASRRSVHQAVEGHGGAPGPHHGQQNIERLAPAGQASRPQERAHKRKGQREHGVLDLDHFQEDLQAFAMKIRGKDKIQSRPSIPQHGLEACAITLLSKGLGEGVWGRGGRGPRPLSPLPHNSTHFHSPQRFVRSCSRPRWSRTRPAKLRAISSRLPGRW
jgi:hypothetical protein